MITTTSPETWMNSDASLRDELISYADEGLLPDLLAETGPESLEELKQRWLVWALEHQKPPLSVPDGHAWTTWLILGGRGAGKTRAGAQWVRGVARGELPYATTKLSPIALVGETEHEVREVMIEGVSGILAVHERRERPVWIPSRRRLEWPSGVVAQAFSAEDPESLRGPQFAAAWADELAKWRHAEATFDMLQFGLRLGERPRQVITTTPRPMALLKRLMADPATVVTRASTRANAYHLSPALIDTVFTRYGGTRLGRQELDGEIIEDRAGALWTRALIETARVAALERQLSRLRWWELPPNLLDHRRKRGCL